MPEYNVEPVQHGRWIGTEDVWYGETVWQCSICKEKFLTINGIQEENLWNYCPYCGAKMDLEN